MPEYLHMPALDRREACDHRFSLHPASLSGQVRRKTSEEEGFLVKSLIKMEAAASGSIA